MSVTKSYFFFDLLRAPNSKQLICGPMLENPFFGVHDSTLFEFGVHPSKFHCSPLRICGFHPSVVRSRSHPSGFRSPPCSIPDCSLLYSRFQFKPKPLDFIIRLVPFWKSCRVLAASLVQKTGFRILKF